MTAPLFNRAALSPGMILGRMSPTWLSRAIVLRTQGFQVLRRGNGWSHDAILIAHNGHWYVGDSEPPQARLTPLEEWERQMREDGCRVIVLRPVGATPEQMECAAWSWQTAILGTDYDSLAIAGLAWRWLAERFGHKLGREDDFYCTEGCQAVYRIAMGHTSEPWAGKKNPTPGTTRKRTIQGRFRIVHQAFTAEGRNHTIQPGA